MWICCESERQSNETLTIGTGICHNLGFIASSLNRFRDINLSSINTCGSITENENNVHGSFPILSPFTTDVSS